MNEEQRLATLHGYGLLDTPPEEKFDDVVRRAAKRFGVPVALISLIDADRQWFKAKIGLEQSETPRSMAFCAYAIEGDDVMVVCDATADDRFIDNPLVTGDPSIRFYAGAPIVADDGSKLGTVCVIDRKMRENFDDAEKADLVGFSREVSAIAAARRRNSEEQS